jgi:heme-degrading monooxygenase HmoA
MKGWKMVDLQLFPPHPEALSAMLAIPGVQVAPTILATQQGPDGGLGPESAGAVLMLQATFSDAAGARAFWDAAVPLMDLLAKAPGFIRRYSFPDGLSVTLIALWRTVDDARAFAALPEHRAAVRDLYEQRWQYSHFSALWEMASNHGRQIFCDQCDGVTPASEGACRVCGTPFVDIYRVW